MLVARAKNHQRAMDGEMNRSPLLIINLRENVFS